MTMQRAQRTSLLVLAALMLAVGVFVLREGEGTVAFFDEWDWITRRRGVSADTLFEPHNGHLSVLPVLVYKVLLQLGGLTDYWLFRVVLVLAHLACVALVFLLARSRVGTIGAAFAAGFIAVLGAASDDLLWPFQIGFVGGVALGLGALLALDAHSRRGDLIAAVLLGLSLASASVGAAFIIAATVEIALDPRRRERWWVIAAPLALYALWYLGYGESELRRDNLDETPIYAAESGAAAIGGLVGLTMDYGRILLIGLAAVVARHLAGPDRLAPRLVALAVAAPAIWLLTGLSRAHFHEPQAPRYIYTGAVLVVLLVCELARGRSLTRPAQAVMLAGLLAFTTIANANVVDLMGNTLQGYSKELRARLGALDLVSARVPPDFQPAPVIAPQVRARGAMEAQRDFGRIALSLEQLRRAPQAQGAAADNTLILAQSLTAAPATAEEAAQGASCTATRPSGPDTRTDVVVRAGETVGIRSQVAAGVVARRFAPAFGQAPLVEIPAGGGVLVRAAPDAASGAVPWRLQVASAGRVEVCRGR